MILPAATTLPPTTILILTLTFRFPSHNLLPLSSPRCNNYACEPRITPPPPISQRSLLTPPPIPSLRLSRSGQRFSNVV